jgi:hypothetical protein
LSLTRSIDRQFFLGTPTAPPTTKKARTHHHTTTHHADDSKANNDIATLVGDSLMEDDLAEPHSTRLHHVAAVDLEERSAPAVVPVTKKHVKGAVKKHHHHEKDKDGKIVLVDKKHKHHSKDGKDKADAKIVVVKKNHPISLPE